MDSRLSNSWTTYKVQYRDGAYIPMDAQGAYLDSKQLDKLIRGLQFTLSMIERGSEPEQLIYGSSMACLNEIMDSATWIDSSKLSDYEYCDDNQYRRIESGNCVYFLEHPTNPKIIKIGQAINLYQRMKYYWIEWGKQYRPKLYAVIQTPHHKQLERLIHLKLDTWRVTGEWFERPAVLEWIEGVAS